MRGKKVCLATTLMVSLADPYWKRQRNGIQYLHCSEQRVQSSNDPKGLECLRTPSTTR